MFWPRLINTAWRRWWPAISACYCLTFRVFSFVAAARRVARSWLLKAAADCFVFRLFSALRSRHAHHARSSCRCGDISVVVPASFVLFVCSLNSPCVCSAVSGCGVMAWAASRGGCTCYMFVFLRVADTHRHPRIARTPCRFAALLSQVLFTFNMC